MELSYAEGWRPEEGDTIIGTVTDIGIGSSAYGGTYPIVTVEVQDTGKEVAVHCFHAALRSRMLELRPEVGERIGVKYVGQEPHKTQPGKTVAKYIVKIDGRGAANVWGNLAADTPRSDVPEPAPEEFTPARTTTVADDDDIPF